MPPKVDIGWDHAKAMNGDKKTPKCNYCGKLINGGITRLKQHLAHKTGEVSGCPQVSKELMLLMQQHLAASKTEKVIQQKKKEAVLQSLREEVQYGYGGSQYYGETEGDDTNDPRFHGMDSQENFDMRFAMKDSRRQAIMNEDLRRRSCSYVSGSSSGFPVNTNFGPPPRPPRSSSTREPTRSRIDIEQEIRSIDPHAFSSKSSKQKNIKTSFLKENFKKVGRAIGKWMMFNAIPFNTADSGPYYQTMIETIAEYGKGITGPSGRQIGGIFLQDEVDDLKKYIDDLKSKWPTYGCTIMCDGWSSRNKHSIVNFMVYCKGDMIFHKSVDASKEKKTSDYIYKLMKQVVEEVGKKNVVQIVTDNEAAYKAAGKKLMRKYPHLFWSPCAAHCVDLMLEDIGDIPTVASLVKDAKKITGFIYNSNQFVDLMRSFTNGRELLRPGITRFATEFIAIESLVRYKNDLKRLFTSDEWRDLSYVKDSKRKNQAKEVCKLVLSEQFWKRAEEVIKGMEPLILVLKIVDQERKPTLPVVYDAMDRAKVGIKDSKIKEWKKFWDIIDSRWDRQLHCHLHAAAYFLNPMSRYGRNFSFDEEVRIGLKEVIQRLEPDVTCQAMALTEESIYSDRRGSFGTNLSQASITVQSPADWWYHHGEDAPNLRKIAIKVLSQTCSSSGCERNWSTFTLIHTQIRNRLAMEKLEKLVFVHYNLRLRVRHLTLKSSSDPDYCPIDLNSIFDDQDILDPWMTETEGPLIDGHDNDWLDAELQVYQTREGSTNEIQEISTSKSSSDDTDNGNALSNTNYGNGDNDDVNDGEGESSRRDGHIMRSREISDVYADNSDRAYQPDIDAQRQQRHLNRWSTSSSARGYYNYMYGSGSNWHEHRDMSENSSSVGPTRYGHNPDWMSDSSNLSHGMQASYPGEDSFRHQTPSYASDSNMSDSFFSVTQTFSGRSDQYDNKNEVIYYAVYCF